MQLSSGKKPPLDFKRENKFADTLSQSSQSGIRSKTQSVDEIIMEYKDK